MATVTQESFESQYYITRALFGTRSLFAMTQPHNKSVHTSTYCCESALSTMNMALTSLMPKFSAQKGVTFHTNKARPHHLLCIVRTFLLLCFGILIVTVLDPGLNGNLASGLFAFLIEYP